MKNYLTYIRFVLLTGLILSPGFALAQSCGPTAYKDVSDCQTVFNGAKSATNSADASVGVIATGNGMAVPAQQTNTVGSWAAGSWNQVQAYCGKKLNDCEANCTDPADANYLSACRKQIKSIILAASQAGTSNTTIANAAGTINGDASVQQVGWNPSQMTRRLVAGATLLATGESLPTVGNPIPIMQPIAASCAIPPCN